MRVLMVSDVYFPRVNGVSTAIDTYQRTLEQDGVEVRLIAPDYGNADGENWIERIAARAVPRDPEDRLMRWNALNRATLEAARHADLIHVQTPFLAHYASMRATRQLRLPVMVTYHTLFEEYFKHYAPMLPGAMLRGIARAFSRAQCNDTSAVIVPSRAIHQRLLDYGVTATMHILPTGVPLSRFSSGDRARFRSAHGIAENRLVALYVGRVAHEKNLDYLLDVAAQTRQSVPDFLLVIAGEGPALPHLQQRVAQEGLTDSVQFIGYLDRAQALPDCYASADAFVFASRTETQGLVLLEAMAMGLPVVALAAMGTVDILENAGGAITPPDNVADFSACLAGLLLDDGCRITLAQEAREYAKQWDERVLGQRMAQLYRETIEQVARNR